MTFCYVHVPFCRSRCIYCDFFVVLDKTGDRARHQAFIDVTIRELTMRLRSAALTPWQSLYVGGGTPSLLSADDYARLLAAMRAWAPFSPDAELTLEVNPDDLADSPARFRQVGFNRASVGVQSFDDDLLRRLSRRHAGQQAREAVWQLACAGFENLSLDLMYGLPGQTLAQWERTLTIAVSLPVTHISAYGLKVEDGSALARLSHAPRYQTPDDDQAAQMYALAATFLDAAGFARYEISNFARPGFESRHNLNYWRQGDWLALGPGACGQWAGERYETARDWAQWQSNPLAGECARIGAGEALENALIFGLRTREGVCLRTLRARFGEAALTRVLAPLARHRRDGWLQEVGERLTLAPQAFALSNALLADLIGATDDRS